MIEQLHYPFWRATSKMRSAHCEPTYVVGMKPVYVFVDGDFVYEFVLIE
jgi:hypothetical protein